MKFTFRFKKTQNVLIFCVIVLLILIFQLHPDNQSEGDFPQQVAAAGPRIFCIILTQEKNLDTKAYAAYAAWAHKCDNHTFITAVPGHNIKGPRTELRHRNLFNVLKPSKFQTESYDLLTSKVYAAYEDIWEFHPGYDWYVMKKGFCLVTIKNLHKSKVPAIKNSTDSLIN